MLSWANIRHLVCDLSPANGVAHSRLTAGLQWCPISPIRIHTALRSWCNVHGCVTVQRRGGRATLAPSLLVRVFDRLARTPGDSILSFCIAGGGSRGAAYVQGHWDGQPKAAGLHFLLRERI